MTEAGPLEQVALSAAQEVLGRDGSQRVLSRARSALSHPPNSESHDPSIVHSAGEADPPLIEAMLRALEAEYGPQSGRGLALRIGRVSFRHGVREYGWLAGGQDRAFRLLPLPSRIRAGLNSLADLLNREADARVQMVDMGGRLVWRMEGCPLCAGRASSEPICYFAVGLLQEALDRLSGGRSFTVEERACVSRGDPACSFLIDPMPIA